MIGRVGARRSTSTKPASIKVEARPVKTDTVFFFSPPESIGYPSTIFAPRCRANWIAAFTLPGYALPSMAAHHIEASH